MTGGQVIIPIRDNSNNKVVIVNFTTPYNLKIGTYAKIKKALELQKEIILNDLLIGDNIYSSASLIACNTSPDFYSFVFEAYISGGAMKKYLLTIANNDTLTPYDLS